MRENTVIQIIDLMDSTIKNIASKFEKENVTCYTNLYYINGHPVEGICLLTDGEPGGIVYQTPQNDTETIALPVFQLIPPEEWDEWIDMYGNLFTPQFPPYTEE